MLTRQLPQPPSKTPKTHQKKEEEKIGQSKEIKQWESGGAAHLIRHLVRHLVSAHAVNIVSAEAGLCNNVEGWKETRIN